MSRLAARAGSLTTMSGFRSRLHITHQPFSLARAYATESLQAPEYLDAGERKIFEILKDGLEPVRLEVQDMSGGCGSTYALDIVSSRFAGLPLLQQHRLVKTVLGDEFKRWHGIQLKTQAPK